MSSSNKPLSRRFYSRASDVVARALLGKYLVSGSRAGMIVETEAYLGPHDRASHARFGPTARNAVMFGRAGVAYVYLCYGVYDLFNVVTGPAGQASAVLIRALEPVRGIGTDASIAKGPGKLTRALEITREHSGLDLTEPGADIYVARGKRVASAKVVTGPRVGIDYAKEWAGAPLRFWIAGHPSVSKAR